MAKAAPAALDRVPHQRSSSAPAPTLNTVTAAAAFNEWMRRYTQEPERFARDWQTVGEYLAQTAAGKEPDYGRECAEYLLRIVQDLRAAGTLE